VYSEVCLLLLLLLLHIFLLLLLLLDSLTLLSFHIALPSA